MKNYLILLFIFFLAINTQAQQKDTTVRKYLVLKPHGFLKKPIIIKAYKTIIVKDKWGIKNRGRLHILNDSSFFIYNAFRNEADTYLLCNITSIKKPTFTSAAGSVLALGTSVAYYALAGWVFEDSDFTAHGIVLIALGLSTDIIAFSTFNGPKYSNKKYTFQIVTTKGYKLKRYHLRSQ